MSPGWSVSFSEYACDLCHDTNPYIVQITLQFSNSKSRALVSRGGNLPIVENCFRGAVQQSVLCLRGDRTIADCDCDNTIARLLAFVNVL
jgi:hypothetical protein